MQKNLNDNPHKTESVHEAVLHSRCELPGMPIDLKLEAIALDQLEKVAASTGDFLPLNYGAQVLPENRHLMHTNENREMGLRLVPGEKVTLIRQILCHSEYIAPVIEDIQQGIVRSHDLYLKRTLEDSRPPKEIYEQTIAESQGVGVACSFSTYFDEKYCQGLSERMRGWIAILYKFEVPSERIFAGLVPEEHRNNPGILKYGHQGHGTEDEVAFCGTVPKEYLRNVRFFQSGEERTLEEVQQMIPKSSSVTPISILEQLAKVVDLNQLATHELAGMNYMLVDLLCDKELPDMKTYEFSPKIQEILHNPEVVKILAQAIR